MCALHESGGGVFPPFFEVIVMIKKFKGVAVSVAAAGFALPIFAAGPDFTGLTGPIDWSTAIAAILLVMGGLAGVYIVMKGGDLILSKLRGR